MWHPQNTHRVHFHPNLIFPTPFFCLRPFPNIPTSVALHFPSHRQHQQKKKRKKIIHSTLLIVLLNASLCPNSIFTPPSHRKKDERQCHWKIEWIINAHALTGKFSPAKEKRQRKINEKLRASHLLNLQFKWGTSGPSSGQLKNFHMTIFKFYFCPILIILSVPGKPSGKFSIYRFEERKVDFPRFIANFRF